MTAPSTLTRIEVLKRAAPLVLANAAAPLVGLVDTFVISVTGDAAALGGVGLGAVAFAFILFGFYFLRMGTTGLAAQAAGADDEPEVQRTLIRALIAAAGIGAAVVILAPWLIGLARLGFDASADAESAASSYLSWRAFGTPATMMALAIQGWLIGVGRARDTLVIQLALSGANAVFDVWFVLGLGWGPAGVGAGTALAEWMALGVGAAMAWRAIAKRGGVAEGAMARAALLAPDKLQRLVLVNRDLMIRSATLLFGFAWFTNQGARQGDAALAGNEVLKQVITIWAFVLDAFAFTAEAEVGAAIGRRSPAAFMRAVRLTTEIALVSGLAFAGLTLLFGPPALAAIIRDPAARDAAIMFLPYCALVPLIGVPAWQLDGIFVGATRGAAMRNAGIASVAFYIATDLAIPDSLGNHGVWLAFLAFYFYRALTLAVAFPSVMRAARGVEPKTAN